MTLPQNRLQEFVRPEDVARFNMIEQQIRPWNVDNSMVLAVLARVKRERFVPPAYYSLAFMDIAVPLVPEEQLLERPDAVMLPPKIEARMLQNLAVQPHERVLLVGAGSGHFAALLAAMGKEVVAVDIAPDMVAMASQNLRDNGVDNVQVLQRDASVDVPAGGFDVIALSGSVAELPQHLLAALNDGGRLIACVGEDPIMRMHVVTKRGGQFEVQTPWDYNLPRLQNFPEASAFEF